MPTPVSAQATGTNPFAKSTPSPGQQNPPFSSAPFGQPSSASPFQSPAPGSFQQQPGQLAPQPTGSTNPFAKPTSQAMPQQAQQPAQPPFGQGPLMSTPTGSTNPFRQSQFVNQGTGGGWQHNAQGTIGGMSTDAVDTVPIFPRPAMG